MTSRQQAAENRDIRAWAKENGVDLAPRARIPAELRESYRMDYPSTDDGDSGSFLGSDDDPNRSAGHPSTLEERPARIAGPDLSSDPERISAGIQGSAERAPIDPRKRSVWQRVSAGRRSGGPRKRESLSMLGQFAWGGLAQAAARSGRIPTSRMLQLQAPIAGTLIDEGVRGTLVDRVLQPFARGGKRGETLFALVGPPLLVDLISRHPERQDVLVPLLAAALESYAEIAGPKLAAAKRRAEKRAEEIGANDIQELIAWIFADTPVPAGADGGGDGGRAAA